MNNQLNFYILRLYDHLLNFQKSEYNSICDLIILPTNVVTTLFKSNFKLISKLIQKIIQNNDYHGINLSNLKMLINKLNNLELLIDSYVLNHNFTLHDKIDISNKQYYLQFNREYLISFYNHILNHLI